METLSRQFGPKAFAALIEALEPLIDMMPGTLVDLVKQKTEAMQDFEWMKEQDIAEEIAKMAIELNGLDKKAFKDLLKEGQFKACLEDLFDKVVDIVDQVNEELEELSE
jgi:hypothetical protein